MPLFQNQELYRQHLSEIGDRIDKVVEGGRFILGPEVTAFEKEFAKYLGVKHVVGLANGTDALTISLRALGIGPGDEVIVPAFTFYATAESVPHTGAKPVFCDVDPDTFCITAETVERALTGRTRAVIGVHLFGNLAPMEELLELAADRGLYMIEDTAQATGATLSGLKAGSFGHASTFSFFPSKNLFCFGDGGAVATNSDKVAQAVKSLRFHGSVDKRTFKRIGYNSRLDEIQAAILRVLLPHLDTWNKGRRRVATQYRLKGLGDQLQLPVVTDAAEHVYHLYTVKSAKRNQLQQLLSQRGVESRPYYVTPLHRQPAMQEFSTKVELPVTEELAKSNLALPIGPLLTDMQIDQVVSAVADLG